MIKALTLIAVWLGLMAIAAYFVYNSVEFANTISRGMVG